MGDENQQHVDVDSTCKRMESCMDIHLDHSYHEMSPVNSTSHSQSTTSTHFPISPQNLHLKMNITRTHQDITNFNLYSKSQRPFSDTHNIVHIEGDGNCFYRCISNILTGVQTHHHIIRQHLCDFISSRSHLFQPYCHARQIESHIADQVQLGTWATECEIFALATWLNIPVYVYAPVPGDSQRMHWLLLRPIVTISDPPVFCPGYYITLQNTSGVHYEVVEPCNGCNCQTLPPKLDGLVLSSDAPIVISEGITFIMHACSLRNQ